LKKYKTIDWRGYNTIATRTMRLYFVLPDLSDIIVKGDFIITDMRLNSLKGCPKIVTDNFEAYRNNLKSLEGGPEVVGQSYTVESNNLETLQGCGSVILQLNIRDNKKLKNLKGCPEYIYSLLASGCGLESLEGGPKRVVRCNVNSNKLTSLEHGPEAVMQKFVFSDNPLKSIKGYPKYVDDTDIEKITNPSLTYIVKELGIDYRTPYYLDDGIMKDLNIYNIEQMNSTELIRSFDPYSIKFKQDLESKTQEAIQQYKQKTKQINKESLLYNLMKSYLLRS
jgi:hypothetical protein